MSWLTRPSSPVAKLPTGWVEEWRSYWIKAGTPSHEIWALLHCLQVLSPQFRQFHGTWCTAHTAHHAHNSLWPSDTIWRQHDDVIKWKHFPRNWPFVRGIHRSPVNSPHKGQWRGALMFSLICVWINDWVHNREAGDLRRYLANYDVIAMETWVNIGLGNGLLPDGTKPLLEPVLTYHQSSPVTFILGSSSSSSNSCSSSCSSSSSSNSSNKLYFQ